MNSNATRKSFIVFGVISGLLSLLCLITDIIILIKWYQEDRMIFFWISICVLFIAQCSYITLFHYIHNPYIDCQSFGFLICMIILSPFVPSIFYFTAQENSYLRRFIANYFCIPWETPSFIEREPRTNKHFLQILSWKCMLYILQYIVESLPQSIIQYIALIYYKEINLVSIISIILSLVTISIPLLIISNWRLCETTDWKYKLFSYATFMIDLVGIYFMISFIFYTPTNNAELQIFFVNIGKIYIYKFYFCIIPFLLVGSVGMWIYWTLYKAALYGDNVVSERFCFRLFAFGFLYFFIMLLGIIYTALIMTICCLTYIGITIIKMSTSERIIKKDPLSIISWIFDESMGIKLDDNIIFTKKDDEIYRLCVVNKIMTRSDETLSNYLKEEEKTAFKNVTYKCLRRKCDKPDIDEYVSSSSTMRHSNPFYTFWYLWYANILTQNRYRIRMQQFIPSHAPKLAVYASMYTVMILNYILGPIYFIISPFLNIFMPSFILFSISNHDDHIVNNFHLPLCFVYVLFSIIWFILCFYIIKREYYLWHILPNKRKFTEERVMKQMTEKYFEIIISPIIKQLLSDIFGTNISNVILDYLIAKKVNAETITSSNITIYERINILPLHDLHITNIDDYITPCHQSILN